MVSFHQLIFFIVITLVIVSHSNQLAKSPASKQLPTTPTVSPRLLISLNPKNKKAVEDLKSELQKRKIKFRIVHQLTASPEIFYGVSLELLDETQAKLLNGVDGVQDVKEVGLITRGPTYPGSIQSKPLTTSVDKFPPHLQTNISMLHKQAIYGKGIKVALIDSGIDCTHPAFGGGFGSGKKIAFGRSFVDNDDPQSRRNTGEISNPCSDCSRHGTHTAGIIGAADVGYGFQGVAPHSTLGMYRVFGCDPGTTDDVIIQALIQAQLDGADIISMSLGSPGGWSTGKSILDVINKLVERKGSMVFVSAGNEGMDGLFSGSSPASARAAISVGSVDSSSPMARTFTASTGKVLTYYKNQVLPDGSYPVYFTSDDLLNEDDSCSELRPNTPDLANYVVLIKIGSCFISEKVFHARAKGAKLIFLYMKSRVVVSMHSEVLGATVAGISLEDAQHIAEESKKDPTAFRLQFKAANHPTFVLQPGLQSPFSQYGPSFDFVSPQPAISGIGGNVVSTYPMVDGAFASLSGTSMSAPQLAGIAALVLSHRGKAGFNGYNMRDRLTTSSRIMNYAADKHKPQTVVHQGGGLINAWCAVMANTIIPNATLTLSDSISFNPEQQITIFNTGKTAIQYRVSHLPAISVKTFAEHEKYNRPDVTPDIDGQVAEAAITPQVFSLASGSKQVIKIHFTKPKASSTDLTVYSGYIVLTGNAECESHNVPYYGVVGSLKDQEIIDRGPVWGTTGLSFPFIGIISTKNLMSIQQADFNWDLKQYPTMSVRFRTVFGSPLLRVDVISGDANPSPSKKPTKGSDFEKSFGGATIVGRIPGAQFPALARSPVSDFYYSTWDATTTSYLEDNKVVPLPNGKYRILIRALRVGGRMEVETDVDFWTSPPFRLVR